MLDTRIIELLEQREIDPELAARMGIDRHDKDGGDWISIPYSVAGKIVNHKYRTLSGEKKFYQDADARKTFWNVDVLTDPTLSDETLIITEGEMDAMVMLQVGYPRTMSCPDGAPATSMGAPDPNQDEETGKYSYVAEVLPLLRACKEVILLTDGDIPGQNLRLDLAIRLGRARCKWVEYPPACKDANDVLLRYGVEGVRDLVRKASWFRVDGIYRMSELPEIPDPTPYLTGFPTLDTHYKVRMGDTVVVTGIPGSGKTTWVNDLVCRLADTWGWTIGIASFEQLPQTDHRRFLRKWKMRLPEDIAYAEDIAAADEWIDRHFSFIVPDDEDWATLDWLFERAAASVIQHGAKVIVIDPWNEIEHDKPKHLSLTEYVGDAIRRFKKFARSFNIHLIIVAHPTKQQRDAQGRINAPTMYDISDSAHWANKPDVGIIIHQQEGMTSVRIAKSRYHDKIGKPGIEWFEFRSEEARFHQAVDPKELNR